ncbi:MULTISPECIES: DHHA1 domain-containing protein [unclassified Bacillus (in: firmicutes)]|uniref:alanyl-tRNA editing protein n=1 Tax=unclassified Bacillus (in: firmicutes) TaxID=185979 RepID=UPI0008F26EDD|nr:MULTISPECIES: DHHA1 domain-containing protein [unclassified Bacillus (in: firmicutes)]SFA79531.1 alanyl-tRNA synthetase [Bacillus sp. UNCCL13]SFQ69556.1 alanyl-tRNA synthetase [Bacillus sp. cl95]
MEHKLYYKDPYTKTFSSKVSYQKQDESGRWYAVLSETAFYPTGGGQPHDTGTIDGIEVIDVEEVDGEIRHYIEKPFEEVGDSVTGVIDWERRFDHMQQHAGQHILSAAFDSVLGFETISFHLGKETLTIDLAIEDLSEEQASAAEALANSIILENRPIETKWTTDSELHQYPMRKMPKVAGDIRLVIIPDFDYNGCGGTHPSSTGQVGAIKILDWERQKKKVRVQFVCGNRVLTQLDHKQKVLLTMTKLLNAPEQDMEKAAFRVLEHNKFLEKSLEDARDALLQFEAKELIQDCQSDGKVRFVTKVMVNRSMQELQKLAKSTVGLADDSIAILVSESDGRLQIVAARGSQVNVSMKAIMGEALPLINGKGGGNDVMAQGGGEAIISGDTLLQKVVKNLIS